MANRKRERKREREREREEEEEEEDEEEDEDGSLISHTGCIYKKRERRRVKG